MQIVLHIYEIGPAFIHGTFYLILLNNCLLKRLTVDAELMFKLSETTTHKIIQPLIIFITYHKLATVA